MKTLQPVHPIDGAEAFEMRPGRLIVIRCPDGTPHNVMRTLAEDVAAQIVDTGAAVAVVPHGTSLDVFESFVPEAQPAKRAANA